MKRLVLALGLTAALVVPALAGGTETLRLFIPGMTACPSCPYIVKSLLTRLEGVKEVETVYETGIATIVYDDGVVGPVDFVGALAEYGYDEGVEIVEPES